MPWSGWKFVTWYGPVPRTESDPGPPKLFPCFSTNAFGLIPASAGAYWTVGSGAFKKIVISPGPVARIDLTELKYALICEPTFLSRWRFSENTASSVVSGVPSQKVTPRRSLYTYRRASGCDHACARRGTSFRSFE